VRATLMRTIFYTDYGLSTFANPLFHHRFFPHSLRRWRNASAALLSVRRLLVVSGQTHWFVQLPSLNTAWQP
jgi:hypothetical protein